MISVRELTRLKRVLREKFGLEQFRPGQLAVIESVIEGRNTLAIMPTGAGKSLCYQLPGLNLPGTTLVVSPLIALMKDQVDKLTSLEIDAVQINSSLTERAQREAVTHIADRSEKLIFTTPERLSDPEFLQTLKQNRINLFVIDEAHCISQWGHDFRPTYLNLDQALKALNRPPVLALTATATADVIEDIAKQLGISDLSVINTGLYRENLSYQVAELESDDEKQQELLCLLNEIEGSLIIYAATIRQVEEITEFLKSRQINVARYHGRLSRQERIENQQRFMNGELRAIVATNAFGMGIDKADIRAVIHYSMPGSLEAYYQESGRAGRDNRPAQCILFYQQSDRRTQLYFLNGKSPASAEIVALYNLLESSNAAENPISLRQLQLSAANIAATKVRIILNSMKEMKLVRELRGVKFRLLKSALSEADLAVISEQYQQRDDRDREKLDKMMSYAQSARCRWKILLEYFQEESEFDRCGNCDNCQHPVEQEVAPAFNLEHHQIESLPTLAEKIEAENAPPEIEKGDLIALPKYGAGEIQAIEGDKIVVTLPNGETKKFKKDIVLNSEVDAA